MTANQRVEPSRFRSMLGMSLVEILVAMLIGLSAMTLIMQVFSVSEGRKRETSGMSDAQISGNLALFTLERELRSAGYGMVTPDSNMLGCTTVAFDVTRNTPDFSFTMAPVLISNGADGAPDQVTVIYGNSAQAINGTDFSGAAGAGDSFPLVNAAGFRDGELVVAADPAAGVDCALVEATGFAPGATDNLEHISGAAYSYNNEFGFTVNVVATRNKPGGLDVGGVFSTDARLYSMGRRPVVITYLIDDNRLGSRTLVPYDPALDADADDLSETDVADGVVQLQAQYGKDTNADQAVDTWDETTPANNTEWLTVRAVRFAILVRSPQFERDPVTTAAPGWFGGSYTMTNLDGTPDSNPGNANDWRHYSYRNYQTVVPLRNMIWSTDP